MHKKIINILKNAIENYTIELLIISIVLIILINTLFINPIIGKCDNGDFGRLMIYGDIDNLSDNYKKIYDYFLHINYSISPLGLPLIFYKDWVSCSLVLKISSIIFFIINGFESNLFDIRYIAFVYSCIFLIGIFFIVNCKKFNKFSRILLGVYIILFFTSTCYIEYFNSFFGEAGTFAFLILTLGTYLNLISKSEVKKRHFIYFFIASACFLTAKSQNIPMLLFMLIIYTVLFISYKNIKIRKTIFISSIIVIFMCCISYFSLTKFINENNIYQSVFSGVLRGSNNPKRDLKELGIEARFKVFKGHSFYKKTDGLNPTSKDMLTNFYPHISNFKILFFYLNHPTRMWQKIVDAANSAYEVMDVPGACNFVKGEYAPNKKFNAFRSILIEKFPAIHRNIYIFIAFSLMYFAICLLYLVKGRDIFVRLLNLMLIFILVLGSSQFILPVIGAGHGDFEKHLFLLNLSYDIMFGVGFVWVINMISKVVKIVLKLVVDRY
ncbi:glycan biosynthesis hexose transferase WsfD [Clostridium felsineum]|uniref:Uncharacterized protein n=1 Tax=Clostridium felsineum TaxID=36839 RepID=A0A1S8L5E6_9CLOT|nr:hypothetical protein [Clostridium felsineum]URZ06629.1 hypothetical protein CLROS_019620 [Clostridium felsineum]URZ11662.1 hypothetical protein CROST_023790 [Clostridium felsineum]